MISTSVKNADSIMNYVGQPGTASKTGKGGNSSGRFADIMNKASGNGSDNQTRGASAGNKQKASSVSGDKEVRQNDSPAGTSAAKTGGKNPSVHTQTGNAKQTEDQDSNLKELENAGKGLVSDVAEEFSLTEEEVLAALEQMGLLPVQLLDPKNLTDLTLFLAGEDVSALLTDEALCGKVNQLLDGLTDTLAAMEEQSGISEEEIQALLETVKEMPSDAQADENPLLSGMNGQTEEESVSAPEVVVTVERDGEVTKMSFSSDENGSTGALKDTVTTQTPSAETQKENTDSKGQDKNQSSSGEKEYQGPDILMQAAEGKTVEVPETEAAQTAPFTSAETQNIMNQIMDYMKIQLTPEADSLEMQLHPASLGTINVQILSKDGGITAQFTAQNEAVKAVLESKVYELAETMKAQGVRVEAVEVTVESHAFESNLWQGGERNGENGNPQKKSHRRINLDELNGEFLPEEMEEEEMLAVQMMQANGGTVDFTA